MINKLLIGVTFHFDLQRLEYLKKVTCQFENLSIHAKAFVVTNTKDKYEKNIIKDNIGNNIDIIVPNVIGHPYFLTWAHLDIFRQFFNRDRDITHFLYLEDDIEIKPNNIKYWLNSRDELRLTGFYPSFVRYEYHKNQTEKMITDTSKVDLSFNQKLYLNDLPSIKFKDKNYCYIGLPNPYQGMYLLDRELAKEHLFGVTSHPEFKIPWGIREKAAQGLTFSDFPQKASNFKSRNLVKFYLDEAKIDTDSLIHHLPNNHANNPESLGGKVPVDNLIIVNNSYSSLLYSKIKNKIKKLLKKN